MKKCVKYIVIIVLLLLYSITIHAYNDSYGFCIDVVNYEKRIKNSYDISPYIQNQIHEIVEQFISDCEEDDPGEIAGTMLRNDAMHRMKNLAEKFHFDRRIDLLSNLQNAQWTDLGYPEEKGTRGNFLLRTDLGFNNRYDCIVLREVTNGIALALDPLKNIEGTQYILQEYSFYDNFSQMGEGNKYFVSKDGRILFVERLYEEDYLFNATQFDSVIPLYSILIKMIKSLNGIY